MLADIHMHTSASHGKNTVEEMYYAANEKGIDIQGFSEHAPRPHKYSYPIEYNKHLSYNFPQYIESVSHIKKCGFEHHKVLLGVEIDWLPSENLFMDSVISMYNFDYIIGGVHFLGSWGFDFTIEDWRNLSLSQCYMHYKNYFASLKEMVCSKLMHVVAHFDLIKIFTPSIFRAWINSAEGQKIVSELLIAIRDSGMSLEVSSAGLRKFCKEIYPCLEIIKMAKAQDVSICFSSDAHCKNTIGFAFNQLFYYTKSVGYCAYRIFEKGKAKVITF